MLSDEDEEDETAALMRELEKIKKERAEAKAKEEAERAAEEEEQREIDVARGNPLLNSRDFAMKRRWDDDVVFKNQARGTEDRNKKKEFINDMLRSDFHKKFMVRRAHYTALSGHKLTFATVQIHSMRSSHFTFLIQPQYAWRWRTLGAQYMHDGQAPRTTITPEEREIPTHHVGRIVT
jgi:hypothetical protein